MKHHFLYLLLALTPTNFLFSQEDSLRMDFEAYNPVSTLVVPENLVTRAKYPFIDVHNHQRSMLDNDLSGLVASMDSLNLAVMVNLSGRGYDRKKRDIKGMDYFDSVAQNIKTTFPNRFILFTNVSFKEFGQQGWIEEALDQLEGDVDNGANGLKIYKSLGMRYKDNNEKRVPVDDPRLDPIWAKCAELGIPVLIHSADPKPFWDTHDENNERWLELKVRPRRKRSDTDPVPWQQIIQEQHNLFKKNPKTIFINAHMGWMANDLNRVSKHLDDNPNVYVEIGAIIAELGRQPRAARKFFEKYQDRIMFGKDSWKPKEYHTYFRILETEDEYFPYYKKYHAFWRMYGLGLSDEILKKVYYKNALKVVPNIDASLFPD
ncbi:MAG: amidohydrolase family protein [Bacteroidetes bacterium]|nr:amidohydrolase family protein [Bacteroidota bacterium]